MIKFANTELCYTSFISYLEILESIFKHPIEDQFFCETMTMLQDDSASNSFSVVMSSAVCCYERVFNSFEFSVFLL